MNSGTRYYLGTDVPTTLVRYFDLRGGKVRMKICGAGNSERIIIINNLISSYDHNNDNSYNDNNNNNNKTHNANKLVII